MRTKEQKHDSYSGFIGKNGGAPTAPVNTVAPVITGTAQVGVTLSTTGGTWTGKGAPVLYCQWLLDGVAIPGAWPGKTYVPVVGDVGKKISVRVTGENWKAKVAVTSAQTANVVAA